MVDVDGHKCLDGGCSCHIPYKWAMEQGYENIVVIKTRERGYRKKESSTSNTMAPRFYKDNPEFAEKLMTMNADSNKECDEIDQLEKSEIETVAYARYAEKFYPWLLVGALLILLELILANTRFVRIP